jgi:UDP-glucose 6-dehydrogenase
VKLVESADHDSFREMEMGRMRGLMKSPVVVDCKNIFDKGSGGCLFGYREG